jgi:nitrous oxide reductase accessory protein NosL
MKRNSVQIIVLALLIALPLLAGAAGTEPARCAQCGMLVDEASPFSAMIVDGGKTLHFCDIGDMLLYLKEKKTDPALAQVKDYRSGIWMAVEQAFFVNAPKKFRTPMGWGIAAFQSRSDASGFGDADDLTATLQRIK